MKKATKKAVKKTVKKAVKKTEQSRPRVKITGTTMILGKTSPLKGRVLRVNPQRKKPPVPLLKPVTVILSREEAIELKKLNGKPGSKMVASALAAAKACKTIEWDHIEVRWPNGTHAFDLAP